MSPEFYSKNRSSLATNVPGKIIVIAGNTLMQRVGDDSFPFRQESNLLYLTGLTEPNICLVMNTENGEEFIMIDPKPEIQTIFEGGINETDIKATSGVGQIKNFSDGLTYIVKNAKNEVLSNIPKDWEKTSFTQNSFRQTVQRRLRARSIKISDVSLEIAKLRMVKQPQEIATITKAVSITKKALTVAESALSHSKNESQLESIITIEFAGAGVAHGYEPIIASGHNATTLHYRKNNSFYKMGDVVLFDVGAEVANYSADISRTYVAGSGGPNNMGAQVIASVSRAQAELVEAVKPGTTWKQLHELSEKLIGQSLVDMRVITSMSDVRKYFPHAFGHYLGLDVHDTGDYSAPLQEGMILTVEPGIYIPEMSIGVRIEDDILVTSTGAKML